MNQIGLTLNSTLILNSHFWYFCLLSNTIHKGKKLKNNDGLRKQIIKEDAILSHRRGESNQGLIWGWGRVIQPVGRLGWNIHNFKKCWHCRHPSHKNACHLIQKSFLSPQKGLPMGYSLGSSMIRTTATVNVMFGNKWVVKELILTLSKSEEKI